MITDIDGSLIRKFSTLYSESVGICLMIFEQGACNRLVQERFQYSSETIHRHFYSILKRLNIMSMDITLHLV